MGRIPNFRSNFDSLKTLTLADLKRYGLMVGKCSGTIRWTRREEETGSIRVVVSVIPSDSYVELAYTLNDSETLRYKIKLVQLLSNLGKGTVWYFVCPLTGERCRTLYQTGKYFASRKAHQGTLYESQTYSKHYRDIEKTYGSILKVETAFDELFKPYAKPFYRGKPTPKARKVLTWQQKRDMANGQKPKSWEEYVYGLKYDCGM